MTNEIRLHLKAMRSDDDEHEVHAADVAQGTGTTIQTLEAGERIARLEAARRAAVEASGAATRAATAAWQAWQAVLLTTSPDWIAKGDPVEEAAWKAREEAIRAEDTAVDLVREVTEALRRARGLAT